jgi:hypothetical protein
MPRLDDVCQSLPSPAVVSSRQRLTVSWFGADGSPLPLSQSWVEEEQAHRAAGLRVAWLSSGEGHRGLNTWRAPTTARQSS